MCQQPQSNELVLCSDLQPSGSQPDAASIFTLIVSQQDTIKSQQKTIESQQKSIKDLQEELDFQKTLIEQLIANQSPKFSTFSDSNSFFKRTNERTDDIPASLYKNFTGEKSYDLRDIFNLDPKDSHSEDNASNDSKDNGIESGPETKQITYPK